jgi:malate dehydrogenase (oxaloacetate-decarboxylating)
MARTGKNVFQIALRGDSILANPHWNKGTAFTMNERIQFGLVGRLPYQVNTLDQQCQRAYDQLSSRETPLRKNSFLQSLKEQNSVLFYQLLLRHLKELMPIVYTPTEARAVITSSTSGLLINDGTGRCNCKLLALVQTKRRPISKFY